MKTLTTLFLMVCIIGQTYTKAQDFTTKSLQHVGSTGWDILSDIAFDSDGNYYLAGSFSDTLKNGEGNIISQGKRDIFLAQFNKDHQMQWLQNIGGTGDEHAFSVVCDANNVYLAGAFSETISLNGDQIATGITDAFVANYTTGGTLQWAKIITGPVPARKAVLQTDSEGNIWLAGSFAKQISFGEGSLDAPAKTTVYALKLDATNGNVTASFKIDNANVTCLNDFAIGADNGLYFAGYYEKNIHLGSYNIDAHGKKDAFVCKYNTNGDMQWLQTAGGHYDDEAKSLVLGQDDLLFATGDFKDQITFQGASGPIVSNKSNEVFIASYNTTNGVLQNSLALGGSSTNYGSAITLVGDKKIYLSGSFKGNLSVGGINVGTQNLSKDVYLARFSMDGTGEDVLKAGGGNEDQMQVAYSKEAGGLFAIGSYSNNFEMQDSVFANDNYKDLFFAKLVDCFEITLANLGNDTAACQGTSIVLEAPGGLESYKWNGVEGTNQLEITATGTNTYLLEAVAQNGCVTNDTISVAIHANPTVNLGPEQTMPSEGFLYLVADQESNNSYTWTGGQSCRILYVSNITEPTQIELAITDENNCVGTGSITINPAAAQAPMAKAGSTATGNLDAPTSESEAEEELTTDNLSLTTYKVYPNPTDGKFYVSVSKPEQVKVLAVYDLRGNLVKSYQKGLNFPVQIDLSEKAKGVYVVKVEGEENSKTLRVVKE